MIERRTELRRTGRIRSVSRRRAASSTARADVVAAVFDRDRGCRLRHRGDCYGRPTPHHLRKAGAGGADSIENLVELCEFHNGWVEDHPDEPDAKALTVRDGHPDWQRLGRRAHDGR